MQSAGLTILARAVSIAGHPAILLPLATWLALTLQAPGDRSALSIVAIPAAIAVLGVVYTLVQVHRGRWAHVDASSKHERRDLNGLLGFALPIAALLAWLAGARIQVSVALLVAAGVVLLGAGLARWLKLSLHVAFAVFAAALLWPAWPWVACGLLLALLVAWSRLVLARHTPVEVAIAFPVGALAGLVFQLAVHVLG